MKQRFICSFILLVLCQVGHTDISLSENVTVAFASQEQAGVLLARSDAYTERLSPFDRISKTQSTTPVSNEQFRAHAGGQGLSWSLEEQAKFTGIFANARRLLAPYVQFLPRQVTLVKTTGNEEAGAFYTRGDSIFIPAQVMSAPEDFLGRIMLHELFHVISRNNPVLRDQLYAAIGFVKTSELELPSPLDELKITNPDVPVFQHLIKVTMDNQPRWATPIIYSDTDYDPAKERSFFRYIKLELLLYDWDGRTAPVAAQINGKPHLVALDEVGNFFEQIGRNTDYLYHAEEVLAENFVLLAQGKSAPSPEVLEKMRVAFVGESSAID